MVSSPAKAALRAALRIQSAALSGFTGFPFGSRRYSVRSGMLSSSLASMTRPRAPAASTSLILAARTSSCVALCSESSSCWESWYLITAKRPAPRSRMISPNVATCQNVRRRRRRTRRWMPLREESASVTKPVSGASHCLNQLRRIFVVDLAPQAPHQHLEHIGEGIVVLIPDVGGNCRAIDHLSLVQDKKLEKGKFLCRELYGFSGAPHPLRLQIDFEVGNAECLWEWGTPPSPQCPHPREKFPEREGLGQVIVRSDFQPRHSIIYGVARSEHEDGRPDLTNPQLTAEIESVSTRKHDIEDEHVEAAGGRFHLPLGVAGHCHYLHTVLGDTGLYNDCTAGVVLHQKNSHWGNLHRRGAGGFVSIGGCVMMMTA